MELRPYQKQALTAIKRQYLAGCRKQCIVLATGLGKTIIFAQLIHDITKYYKKKALILVHREELLTQARDKLLAIAPDLDIGLEMAEKTVDENNTHQVIIASVATIGRADSKRIEKFNPSEFVIIVTDECFVAGTLVDGKPIETLQIGDKVWSWNEKTKEVSLQPIARLFKKKAEGLVEIKLTNGEKLVSTWSHPFWVNNHWMPAYMLRKDDVLTSIMEYDNHNIDDLSSTTQVSQLSHNHNPSHKISERFSTKGASLLFRKMQKRISFKTLFSNNVEDKQKICFKKNEDKQSNVATWKQRKDEAKYAWKTFFTSGWKRYNDISTTLALASFTFTHRIFRIPSQNKAYLGTNGKTPFLLQSGYWNTKFSDSYRSKWEETQVAKSEINGLQKGTSIKPLRVASIKLYKSRSGREFRKLCPDGYVYNLEVANNNTYFANEILVHNCHHASASTYKNVYRHFGVLKNEKPIDEHLTWRSPTEAGTDTSKDILMLGVTATPSRNDSEGIDKIYDKVTYEYGIIKGIESGFLSRIRAYRVDTKTDLTQVKRTAGDFAQGELGDAVNNEERNKLVVKAYLERVAGQQALVFAVDVAHTINLTNEFTKNGLAAAYVTGETPKEERRQMLRDFSTRKIRVLINCAVLTEGFDEPGIQAILLARPTQSGILFQQMVGRGTRLAAGKNHLTLIDFVDNTYRQTLQTTASLFGIPGKLDFQGQDVLEIKEKVDQLIDLAPNTDFDKLDIKKIGYAIEEVDLLSGLKIPEEISESTRLDWHRYTEGKYQLSLPEKRMITIQQQITGEYAIVDQGYDDIGDKTFKALPQVTKDLAEALNSADSYILSSYPEYQALVSTQSRWRTLKPSPKQIDLLQRLGVNYTVIAQVDRGTAARLITKLFNYSKRQRKTKFMGQIS